MKVLGLVGSKRKTGNTSVLVQRALEAARAEGIETELVFLSDYSIEGCRGCEGCKDTYCCVIQDGMQELYPLLLASDAVILGSPAYFYNVTAVTKAFIERCYCLEVFAEDDRSVWLGINEALGGKYAAVIALGEQHSENDLGYTAEVMEESLQALGYRVVDTVKVLGLFAKGDASRDKEALFKAEKAGSKIAKTLLLRQKVQAKLQKPNHRRT